MKYKIEAFLRRLKRHEDGAIIAWSVLLIPLMLGMSGLVVDVGYIYLCQRELQISTDAAAMAAAAQLPNPTAASSSGLNFGAQPGKLNAYPNLNKPMAVTDTVTTVTPGCVSFPGSLDCAGSITANAVQVSQTTTVPTFFIRALAFFGLKSLTSVQLSAVSTAVMQGSTRGPYNVALVMDTTASMESQDGGSNCKGSKVQCAEQGAQILLSELDPCLSGVANCGAATNGNVTNAVDEVSLFTFPAQTPGTQVAHDEMYNTNTSTSCSGKNPNPGCPSVEKYPDNTTYGQLSGSSGNYSMPNMTTANLNTLVSYYQVAPLSSNYRTSDGTSGSNPLSLASSGGTASSPSIVNAVGGNSYFGGTSETGMMALGGESTYFAGALFTAQAYLAANARPNAQNVIILLSDGDANGGTMGSKSLNANGAYPSAIDQCQQAVNVAAAAKAAGTQIYTVGYGVQKGGCESDQGTGLTACSTLQQIASTGDFFVDTSSVKCAGATTVMMDGDVTDNTLDDIFKAITDNLTHPRLIPNNTAFTPTK